VKHRVITVGRPAGWARSAVEEFARRIGGFAEFELVHVKEGVKQEKELWEKSEGWHRVALDERGKAVVTADWKKQFEQWEQTGKAKTAWILGGADGHGEGFRTKCGVVWSLGPQTLSHDLALVVLLEQIYRVESWRAGHPYHRE
jgi:23S rRNA (pseudouridine1915-N3)-methyltransferase